MHDVHELERLILAGTPHHVLAHIGSIKVPGI